MDIIQTFYTVYKITNKINGKIYIGKHQTKNLNDGYMGSGNHLKRAINKYGVENFTKEILFIFDNESEMNVKEVELVNKEFCLREDTYNICEGGKGGFSYINRVVDHKSRNTEIAKNRDYSKTNWSELAIKNNYGERLKKWKYNNPEKYAEVQDRASKNAREALRQDKINNPEKYKAIYEATSQKLLHGIIPNPMAGKIVVMNSEGERKNINKEYYDEYYRQGWMNSDDYKTYKDSKMKRFWVNNGVINKLIEKDQLSDFLLKGFIRGRVTK